MIILPCGQHHYPKWRAKPKHFTNGPVLVPVKRKNINRINRFSTQLLRSVLGRRKSSNGVISLHAKKTVRCSRSLFPLAYQI